MQSNLLNRLSFVSLFLLVVLLPFFFLPFTKIPVEISKGLLLVVGLVFTIVIWTMARFSDGKIVLPRSFLLLSGLLLVLVFFLSSVFSSAPGMSLFGVMFDPGSFWFMFSLFLLMLVASIIVRDQKRAVTVLFGVILSGAVVLIFQSLRLFYPQFLSLGVLNPADVTSNIVGSWNALAIFAGFFSVISLFIIEFFSISKINKFFLGILILISLFLVATVNSQLAWILVGVFALLIFVYKISFSFTANQEGRPSFPIVSFILVVISVLFFMSPQSFGGFLPNYFQISNVEVSPSLSATLGVGKGVIMKHPILGVGPNRFGDAWAMYKKGSDINPTIFWDTHFDFGSGIWPTFAVTTGVLGVLSLLIFFFFFFMTGFRALLFSVKNGMDQVMPAFFIASLYFIVASFFYVTGVVVLILSFAFIGIFIGLSSSTSPYGELAIVFSNNPRKSFLSLLLLVLVMIATAAFGFKYLERFTSIPSFERAISTTDVAVAEPAITKANNLSQNDLYFRTYSQLYLFKFNTLANKSSLSDTEKSDLQTNFNNAKNGALLAINFNKENYQNFQVLGDVYNAAGSLGFNDAISSYQQASLLNPANPGIKLALSRVYFANSKIKEAKDYANQALTLKADYLDALLMLSQTAKSEGNTSEAISFANKALAITEQALAINPNNTNLINSQKNLVQYINSLKNSSSSSSESSSQEKKPNN